MKESSLRKHGRPKFTKCAKAVILCARAVILCARAVILCARARHPERSEGSSGKVQCSILEDPSLRSG
jgi:hypothetical protein